MVVVVVVIVVIVTVLLLLPLEEGCAVRLDIEALIDSRNENTAAFLVSNEDAEFKTLLGGDVDGVERLLRTVALLEVELAEFVAPALALAVLVVAQDQEGVVLVPAVLASLLKRVEILALRDRISFIADNHGAATARDGPTRAGIFVAEIGHATTTRAPESDVVSAFNRAGGNGETGKEGDGEEKREAHG
jgi:hypothetical protein